MIAGLTLFAYLLPISAAYYGLALLEIESKKRVIGVFFNLLLIAQVWRLLKVFALAYNRDLRKLPGPWLSRFTNVPLKLRALSGKRNSYIDRLHHQYGPFVRVAPNEVSVSDIDAYREIHKVNTTFSKAPWYQKLSPKQYNDDTCAVFGIRDHRKAAARRKLFLQAGASASVLEWEPEVVEIVGDTVAKIERDLERRGKADVMKWWSFMTADVLGLIAFGENFGMVRTEQKSQLVKDVETSIILVGLKLEIPWIWDIISFVRIPAFRRFVGLFDRFEAYADTAVANTRVAAKNLSKTMFSKMAAAESEEVPEHVIRQEAVNIIIAGTDTTAVTLTYLVYAVLADKTGNIRKTLLTELVTVSNHAIWSELEQLPYLNCVVDEALRLYSPIGGSLPRVPPAGGATLGHYHIPADTIVMTQSSSFHTDPNVFNDPHVFNPRRWESPTAEMKEYFMPFGGRARSCLGMNIARLEILHAVALLFKRCPDIGLALSIGEDSMKPLEFFVSRPKGGKCEIVLGNHA